MAVHSQQQQNTGRWEKEHHFISNPASSSAYATVFTDVVLNNANSRWQRTIVGRPVCYSRRLCHADDVDRAGATGKCTKCCATAPFSPQSPDGYPFAIGCYCYRNECFCYYCLCESSKDPWRLAWYEVVSDLGLAYLSIWVCLLYLWSQQNLQYIFMVTLFWSCGDWRS